MMKMKPSAFFLFLLLSIITLGCEQNSPPPELIEEDAYIDLLVELQLLKSFKTSVPADSGVVDSLQRQIYSKYNVTQQQFRISHDYYQEQYIEQKKRVDVAIERLRMDHVKNDSANTE